MGVVGLIQALQSQLALRADQSWGMYHYTAPASARRLAAALAALGHVLLCNHAGSAGTTATSTVDHGVSGYLILEEACEGSARRTLSYGMLELHVASQDR